MQQALFPVLLDLIKKIEPDKGVLFTSKVTCDISHSHNRNTQQTKGQKLIKLLKRALFTCKTPNIR